MHTHATIKYTECFLAVESPLSDDCDRARCAGLLDVAALKPNETVVVSGAAGAVGTIAGQIAKIFQCRVVGTAGGQDKCDLLTKELGFDVAIDYKKYSTAEAIKGTVPHRLELIISNRPTAHPYILL